MNSINCSQEKNKTLRKLRISIKRKRDDIMRKTVKKKKKEIKFDISIGSNQMSKGEDIKPRHKNLSDNDIYVVGDGHGGKGCKEIIDSNVDILIDIAFKCGTSEAMKRAIELCKLENSGAMLIIAKYNRKTSELTCSSIGDAFFGVYSNKKCIFKQPVHKTNDCALLEEKKIKRVKLGKGVPRPSSCGKILRVDYEESKVYYQFTNKNEVVNMATTASLGHNNFECMSPINKSLKIERDSFHFVFSSDGITDVINYKDNLLLECNSAERLINESKKRWLESYWEMHYKNYRGKYNGVIEGKQYVARQTDADDCTVIVARYSK